MPYRPDCGLKAIYNNIHRSNAHAHSMCSKIKIKNKKNMVQLITM